MLLILTNSDDATADYLAHILRGQHVRFIRFDTDRSLPQTQFRYRVGAPELCFEGSWINPSDIWAVWYRRPERLRFGNLLDSSEGKFLLDEWSEAIEGFLSFIPFPRWMNHPAANVAAGNKLKQLSEAQELGLNVPYTLVTQEPQELRIFFREHDGSIIAKPLSAGHIKRNDGEPESLIYTNLVTEAQLDGLEDLKGCPTLFQQFVNKKSDVRITVVDADIHAVELRAADPCGTQRCDIRRNNMEDVSYRHISLPATVERAIRELMQRNRLRFAAIDMAVSESGDWYFFEINPNGQWAWLDLAGATVIAPSFVNSFVGAQGNHT